MLSFLPSSTCFPSMLCRWPLHISLGVPLARDLGIIGAK